MKSGFLLAFLLLAFVRTALAFTPDCNLGPFDGYRNVMHPAAETLLYSGVSGRPGIVEEAGSLGPNVCSDERAAGTLRAGAFMAWDPKDGRTVVVAVNASTRQKKVVLRTTAPITRVFRGKVTEQSLEVPAMDAAIFEIRGWDLKGKVLEMRRDG